MFVNICDEIQWMKTIFFLSAQNVAYFEVFFLPLHNNYHNFSQWTKKTATREIGASNMRVQQTKKSIVMSMHTYNSYRDDENMFIGLFK